MGSLGANPGMKNMGFFALRVFIIYIAFLLPWPGLSTAYNAWFRSLGRMAALGGHWVVRVEAVPAEEKSPLSTRFLVGNIQNPDAQGNIMVKGLDLDSWGVGWVPTALVLSLILATKLPMRRRFTALLWGLLFINLYVAFCLRVFLWDGTADLMGVGNLSRSVVGALNYTLVTQMGAGLTVAVAIWLAVTFRARDANLLSSLERKTPANRTKRRE